MLLVSKYWEIGLKIIISEKQTKIYTFTNC
uniref:Uncharacterized protein n=1 Tax=Siphoviridae sp. ctMAv2 TaxID=2826258 RepID=A0A8S5LSW8_9CAUD|nr:MAG TPA: hypothetical protein [Siphoviridae sp. ctMAv2]